MHKPSPLLAVTYTYRNHEKAKKPVCKGLWTFFILVKLFSTTKKKMSTFLQASPIHLKAWMLNVNHPLRYCTKVILSIFALPSLWNHSRNLIWETLTCLLLAFHHRLWHSASAECHNLWWKASFLFLFWKFTAFSVSVSCLTCCQCDVLCVNSHSLAQHQNILDVYLWWSRVDSCFPTTAARFHSHWLKWSQFTAAGTGLLELSLSLSSPVPCRSLSPR